MDLSKKIVGNIIGKRTIKKDKKSYNKASWLNPYISRTLRTLNPIEDEEEDEYY